MNSQTHWKRWAALIPLSSEDGLELLLGGEGNVDSMTYPEESELHPCLCPGW